VYAALPGKSDEVYDKLLPGKSDEVYDKLLPGKNDDEVYDKLLPGKNDDEMYNKLLDNNALEEWYNGFARTMPSHFKQPLIASRYQKEHRKLALNLSIMQLAEHVLQGTRGSSLWQRDLKKIVDPGSTPGFETNQLALSLIK